MKGYLLLKGAQGDSCEDGASFEEQRKCSKIDCGEMVAYL